MARLQCLGSSSSGNCFILTCGDEKLIIDLGVSWNEILGGLDYDIANVCGCLCCHVHGDHSKSIPKALYYCLRVFSCQNVKDKYEGVTVLEPMKVTTISSFKVVALPLKHNVENYGFIIYHSELGKLVYAVDCVEFPYNVKDASHWIIEANHDEEIIFDKMLENEYSRSASENHLNILQAIDALKRNKGLNMSTIVLSHLSDSNSNSEAFKKMVKEQLDFDSVYVAQNGLDIELWTQK